MSVSMPKSYSNIRASAVAIDRFAQADDNPDDQRRRACGGSRPSQPAAAW